LGTATWRGAEPSLPMTPFDGAGRRGSDEPVVRLEERIPELERLLGRKRPGGDPRGGSRHTGKCASSRFMPYTPQSDGPTKAFNRQRDARLHRRPRCTARSQTASPKPSSKRSSATTLAYILAGCCYSAPADRRVV